MKNLSAIEQVALSKAVKATTIEAGNYDVDFTVRVKGSITKGEDYESRVTQSASPWKILAVALSKLNGITIESLVKESEAGEIDTSDLAKRADDAIGSLKESTLKTCSGKTTAKITVEVVEVDNRVKIAA